MSDHSFCKKQQHKQKQNSIWPSKFKMAVKMTLYVPFTKEHVLLMSKRIFSGLGKAYVIPCHLRWSKTITLVMLQLCRDQDDTIDGDAGLPMSL